MLRPLSIYQLFDLNRGVREPAAVVVARDADEALLLAGVRSPWQWLAEAIGVANGRQDVGVVTGSSLPVKGEGSHG